MQRCRNLHLLFRDGHPITIVFESSVFKALTNFPKIQTVHSLEYLIRSQQQVNKDSPSGIYLGTRWNNDVEMWPRAVEDDEDFFINRYTWSQDEQQLIDESLEGGARDRCLFDNVVNQTHVRRSGKRDVKVASAWSYDATDSFA